MARRRHNYLQLKTHIITSMLLIARSNINVSWLSDFFFFFPPSSSSASIMCSNCFPSAYGVTVYLNTAVHLAWLLFYLLLLLLFCFLLLISKYNTVTSSDCSNRSLRCLLFASQGQRNHKRFTLHCSNIIYLCKDFPWINADVTYGRERGTFESWR